MSWPNGSALAVTRSAHLGREGTGAAAGPDPCDDRAEPAVLPEGPERLPGAAVCVDRRYCAPPCGWLHCGAVANRSVMNPVGVIRRTDDSSSRTTHNCATPTGRRHVQVNTFRQVCLVEQVSRLSSRTSRARQPGRIRRSAWIACATDDRVDVIGSTAAHRGRRGTATPEAEVILGLGTSRSPCRCRSCVEAISRRDVERHVLHGLPRGADFQPIDASVTSQWAWTEIIGDLVNVVTTFSRCGGWSGRTFPHRTRCGYSTRPIGTTSRTG